MTAAMSTAVTTPKGSAPGAARRRTLDEHLARSRHLPACLTRLADSAAAPADDHARWRAALDGALDGLDRAWTAHILADEDPDGFLSDAGDRAPRMLRALEMQRTEHRFLDDALDAVRGAVAGAVDEVGVAAARYAVARIGRDLEHHLHRGDCIAWEIANEDLGAGD